MEKRTEIILWDAMYEIDPLKQAFMQSANPVNQIPFSSFREEGGFLILDHNPFEQETSTAPKTIDKLVIQQELLMPHFIAEGDFVRLHNAISYKHGWNTIIVDEAIRTRLEGKLPILVINGEKWDVDVLKNEMRIGDNQEKVIPDLHNLTLNHSCLFNTSTREVVSFYDAMQSLRHDLVVVKLPRLEDIDPIGVAIKNGLNGTAYLTRIPQKANHKAELQAYDDTFLAVTAREMSRRLKTYNKNSRTEKSDGSQKTRQRRNGIR